MSERDAYVEKMKAKLDEWNAEIDRLEAKARGAEADARLRYNKQIESLRTRGVGQNLRPHPEKLYLAQHP